MNVIFIRDGVYISPKAVAKVELRRSTRHAVITLQSGEVFYRDLSGVADYYESQKWADDRNENRAHLRERHAALGLGSWPDRPPVVPMEPDVALMQAFNDFARSLNDETSR
jgi:hypothetical protein